MPLPPTIPTATVTGSAIYGATGAPADGRIIFMSPTLQDIAGNIILGPFDWEATVTAGAFSIVLPYTDTLGIVPYQWSYDVRINVTGNSGFGSMPLLTAAGATQEFSSIFVSGTAIESGSSGDLFVNGDLTVVGTSLLTGDVTVSSELIGTFGGVTGNYLEMVAAGMSTGVLFGGEINVNGSNPQAIDIGAFTGYILDTTSTPGSPSLTRIVTTGTTTVALDSGALARLVTWFLMNSAGTIIQQGTRPTNTQRRTHLQLGAIVYDSGLNQIIIDQTLPVNQMNPLPQLYDLMYAIGTFNISGNTISASAADLTFAKTAGKIFAPSFNHFSGATPTNDPHVSDIAAQNPTQFRHLTQSTAGPVPVVTSLDVSHYDAGGVVALIPGGAGVASIFRVFVASANTAAEQVYVQYAQQYYNSLQEAKENLSAENFTVHPSLTENAALVGHIIATKSATNLTISTQAFFHHSEKFDQT